MQPIILSVTEHVEPEHLSEYLRLVNDVADAMRHEANFLYLVVSQDAEDPLCFNYFEAWRDRTDFYDVQMRKAYRDEFENGIKLFLSRPRSIREFLPVREDFAFMASSQARTQAIAVVTQRSLVSGKASDP